MEENKRVKLNFFHPPRFEVSVGINNEAVLVYIGENANTPYIILTLFF